MKTKTVGFVVVTVFLLIVTGFSFLAGRWEGTFAASPAAFPLGTFVTELTRGDIPASLPPVFVFLVGHWEAIFAEGGRLTISKEEQLVLPGRTFPGQGVYDARYAATQNQIAFYADKGPIACDIQERDPRPFVPAGTPATAYSGAYNWTFDGKMLTFTKMADECGGRVVFFTAHPLLKR